LNQCNRWTRHSREYARGADRVSRHDILLVIVVVLTLVLIAALAQALFG
jgi:hypothetical protein